MDETAAKAVKELLPESAQGDLSSLCDWADRVKFRYHWSSPLHYINTPDVCSYQYNSESSFFFHNHQYTKVRGSSTTFSYGALFVFGVLKGTARTKME